MKLHTELKIDAAHKLPNYNGPCHNLHGHTWKVVVEIDCDILDEHEFIVDFRKIKEVVNQFDHAYINDIIKNPTAENMTQYLASQIKQLGDMEGTVTQTTGHGLIKVSNRFNYVTIRVYEAENSFAEITI